jgi:DNA-binding transcriptional regulator YiaG
MATATIKKPKPADQSVPYTIRLPEDRTLFVEVPARMLRRDRDGDMGFTLEGIRFLDRLKALAMRVGDRPTPGHILALRQALDLTQQQLGEKIGVNKLTVSRWERGEIHPGAESLEALRKLRRGAVRRGVVVAA